MSDCGDDYQFPEYSELIAIEKNPCLGTMHNLPFISLKDNQDINNILESWKFFIKL